MVTGWKIDFFGKKINFEPALYPNKCLKQIRYPRSHNTCASISELTSNISTMGTMFFIHSGSPDKNIHFLMTRRNI